MFRLRSIVVVAVCCATPAAGAESASGAPSEPAEAALEAWLSAEPESADASASPNDELPMPPPREHGLVLEGSVGVLGHLGNMRDVSPASPWFRLQVGYELLPWLMAYVQGDLALSSTSYARRPPDQRAYALFGAGAGARLSWALLESLSVYAQGEGGFASVDEDVLSTYGYPDADRLRPFAGAALGLEWYQLSPHYALGVSGGARDYFATFDRINGSRPPWVWLSSISLRYVP